MGFLFLLVSELAFGDACFLMSGREVLTPFFVSNVDFGVTGGKYEIFICLILTIVKF